MDSQVAEYEIYRYSFYLPFIYSFFISNWYSSDAMVVTTSKVFLCYLSHQIIISIWHHKQMFIMLNEMIPFQNLLLITSTFNESRASDLYMASLPL
jgi:hypothetical protein